MFSVKLPSQPEPRILASNFKERKVTAKHKIHAELDTSLFKPNKAEYQAQELQEQCVCSVPCCVC